MRDVIRKLRCGRKRACCQSYLSILAFASQTSDRGGTFEAGLLNMSNSGLAAIRTTPREEWRS
jgi:hypothetical protein